MTEPERIASLVAVRKGMTPPPHTLYVSAWTFAQLPEKEIDGVQIVQRDDFSAYRTNSEPPPDRTIMGSSWDHVPSNEERNS